MSFVNASHHMRRAMSEPCNNLSVAQIETYRLVPRRSHCCSQFTTVSLLVRPSCCCCCCCCFRRSLHKGSFEVGIQRPTPHSHTNGCSVYGGADLSRWRVRASCLPFEFRPQSRHSSPTQILIDACRIAMCRRRRRRRHDSMSGAPRICLTGRLQSSRSYGGAYFGIWRLTNVRYSVGRHESYQFDGLHINTRRLQQLAEVR